MNQSQKEINRSDQVKILLVDDLKDNLLALEGLLRRDDVEIFEAKSGTEALELMIPHEFALALIDVQMPGMSGFELAELMRGANKTKNIPIIFVTATAKGQSFLFKGYESGAVDFLLKPLDTHAVKSKVNIFIELYQQKIERKEAEDRLQLAYEEMEMQVRKRTAELLKSNQNLKREILERKKIEAEIVEVTQAEQRRFGSQLHDGLCQELTAILVFVKALRLKMEKSKAPELTELNKISEMLLEAIDQARNTARGLYPGDLEGTSLMNSLEELTSKTTDVSCLFHCPEPIVIDDNNVATQLYRIAQEGISNAILHGKAQNIEVSFTQNKEFITLSIKDNGTGIMNDFKNVKGIGLKIMKYRAQIINASFQIKPNSPHGVILECKLKRSEIERSAS